MFSDVDVTSAAGNFFAGGLASVLSGAGGRITNSCAVGSVSGYWAGGLAGILEEAAFVEASYAAGAVSSSNAGGGLIGMKADDGGQVTDAYFNSANTNNGVGTPKSTEELQTATPFPNWDTDIWNFEAGKYPALYYQSKQYGVTYDLNEGAGTVPVDPYTYCGFDSVTAESPTGLTPPLGRAFKEWNTAPDGSGFARLPGGRFGMPDQNITLYAIWDTLHTVSYHLNTGSGTAPSSEQHFVGDAFDAASGTGMAAPAGKRFLEWNTAENGQGTAYKPGDRVTMPEGGLALYAVWEPSYPLTYDLGGGVGDAPTGEFYFEGDAFSAADDTGITPPEGMQFKEWNTSSDGKGERYAPGETVTMPAANLTLYAIWEAFQDGSEDYPFLVNDYRDLYAVKYGLGLHYRQTADITLPDPDSDDEELYDLPRDSNWAPLGYELNPDTGAYDESVFTGSYDGGGHTISNLIIDIDTGVFPYAGLFGSVADGATLKNINLVDVKITREEAPGFSGALAGYNAGTITDCTSSGYLSGGSDCAVGGVAGWNEGAITACTSSGYLLGGSDCVVGGIAGINEGAITACTANGCLAGGKDSFVEGIAGWNDGTVNNCTDNTTRAHTQTLVFVEEEGTFYIGDPKDGVEASDLGEGCWSYDGGAGVLTLNNLAWTTVSPQAVVIFPDEDGELTLRLAPGSENAFISLFYGRGVYSCALEAEGNLTIDGTGTLTAQSGISKYSFAGGICVWGDLLINGGTISAAADSPWIASGEAIGIYAQVALRVSGGTVTATGSTQAAAAWDGMTVNIAGGYRYWTNTSASAAGAAGPVNSTAAAFVNSDTYKYIRIAPGLEKEYAPAPPASPAYYADASDGGKVPVTVNGGTGNASLDLSALSERLADGGNIVVTVPPISGVRSYTASLPSASLSGSGAGSLTLSTEAATVTLAGNMLSGTGLTGKAGITIGPADRSSLPEPVQTAIGDRPLISITLTMDGRPTQWSNPNAPVTVSIPYAPTAEELLNPESIVIWYMDGSGNVVTIPSGRYDAASKTVTFRTTHLSDYAVAYNRVHFNDVAEDAWYCKAVSFIAAREITAGTSNGNFSPNAELTRGDFMVLLMRAYGISPDPSPGENFADAGNAYYTGYLKAAKTLGICEGVGGNLFAPGKEITRQEMFVLLYNALQLVGQLPQGKSDGALDRFTDAGSIDPWAREALALLVETGAVRGSSGALRPLDTTIRAEMAQVLYNLLGK